MSDINRFSVTGRLTRNPKIGNMGRNGSMWWISFRIATDINFYDAEAHRYDTRPQFFDCMAKLYEEDDIEWYRENLVKGTQVALEGTLIMETSTVKGTRISYTRPYIQVVSMDIGMQSRKRYSAQRWTPPDLQ